LSKVFEEKLEGDGFEMPGKWKKLGKMIPMQLVARDGWLTAAWQRASAEKPSEVAFAMEGKRRKGKKGDDRQ